MDDSSTVQLDVPKYDFIAMIKFCEVVGKDIEELSEEEKFQFEI